jgi:hypothetical protein
MYWRYSLRINFMNKKTNIGLLMLAFAIGVAAITGLAIAGFRADQELSRLTPVQLVTVSPTGTVAGVAVEKATVTIDRGTGTTLSADVSLAGNATVLEALTQAAEAYGLPLETKSYGDMGTLVNAIGDLTGGQDNKYWIGYVNGSSLTVAVDKQTVAPGDKIEFKFKESIF